MDLNHWKASLTLTGKTGRRALKSNNNSRDHSARGQSINTHIFTYNHKLEPLKEFCFLLDNVVIDLQILCALHVFCVRPALAPRKQTDKTQQTDIWRDFLSKTVQITYKIFLSTKKSQIWLIIYLENNSNCYIVRTASNQGPNS